MLDVSSHGIMCEGEERDFMNNNTDDNNIDKDNVNTDATEEIVAEETIFGGTETEPETAASDAMPWGCAAEKRGCTCPA